MSVKSTLTFKQFVKDNPFVKKMLIVPNYTVGEQYIRQANDQGDSLYQSGMQNHL